MGESADTAQEYIELHLPTLRKNTTGKHKHALTIKPCTGRGAGLVEQESPPWVLSMDYRLLWCSDREQPPSIAVWRPVAPAGYSPVSDVVTVGLDPPSEPVRCGQGHRHRA